MSLVYALKCQLAKAKIMVLSYHPTRGTHLRRYFQDYQTVKKNITFSELSYFFHKYPKRLLQMPKSICLPEVAVHKRAQTGPFALNASDGQPRVGMTDDIVYLLCYFIDYRMLFHFLKSDV